VVEEVDMSIIVKFLRNLINSSEDRILKKITKYHWSEAHESL
jgi:hypothetical protein